MQLVKPFRVIFILLCLITGSALSAFGEARSLDDIKDSGLIRIAVYTDYPPFSFIENDSPTGIDIDIAREIASALGVELELIWMTPGETTEDDFRNYLWKGHIIHRIKADVMMRAPYDPSFSQKRDDVGLLVNELVHMFAPYQRESWQIIHNTQTLPEVETMGMFQYHTIGAEIDSIPHFYLTSAFGGRLREKTSHYGSNAEAIDAMKADIITRVTPLCSSSEFDIRMNALAVLSTLMDDFSSINELLKKNFFHPNWQVRKKIVECYDILYQRKLVTLEDIQSILKNDFLQTSNGFDMDFLLKSEIKGIFH